MVDSSLVTPKPMARRERRSAVLTGAVSARA